jgi:hypothetical protein
LTRLSSEVDGLLVDLALSLWAELGVEGPVRRHDWQAIDLEPLIIFTAQLGATDSRLRESSIEWCITNARFASAFRLRNLAAKASPSAKAAFGRYAATVRAHAKVPWPGTGDPLTMLHRGRVVTPDLRRPSLIQLRLRAFVGVSARAEILRLMLADPERAVSASMLAEDAAYGKGSVVQALDLLAAAGIVQVQPDANRLLYRLTRPGDLAQALQWLPAVFPDWWPIFRITESLADYARAATGTAAQRLVNVRSALRSIDGDLNRLGIAEQVPRLTGSAAVPEFEHWALGFLAEHAGRTELGTSAREVTFVIHHLSFGGWLGTVNQPGRQARPFDVDQDQPDEGAGALQLARAMFTSVLRKDHPQSQRMSAEAEHIQAISGEFAEELIRPMRAGQEATFTSEFVRRWYENRRRRFGATG